MRKANCRFEILLYSVALATPQTLLSPCICLNLISAIKQCCESSDCFDTVFFIWLKLCLLPGFSSECRSTASGLKIEGVAFIWFRLLGYLVRIVWNCQRNCRQTKKNHRLRLQLVFCTQLPARNVCLKSTKSDRRFYFCIRTHLLLERSCQFLPPASTRLTR